MEDMEEAAEAVASWWAGHLERPPGRENGDDDPMARLLAAMDAESVQAIPPERIAAFREALAERLVAMLERHGGVASTRVDYGPDRVLGEACAVAGISPRALPWKSRADIQADGNGVRAFASSGYGAPKAQIWPTERREDTQHKGGT